MLEVAREVFFHDYAAVYLYYNRKERNWTEPAITSAHL